MPRTSAPPRPIGALVLATLALLLAALLPATAAAAPEGGGEPAPVEVTPAAGELPVTAVGFQSPAAAFDFAVSGVEGVSFDGLGIEGANSGDFWIDWGGTDCGGWQERCTVRVVFQPGSVGAKEASLRAWIGGFEAITVPLTAEAVAPELTLEPAAVDFGTQWVYETAERPVTVRNSGAARVSLSGIDVGGPDSGRFWTGYSDCWENPSGWLEPGESCGTSVYFQPDDTLDFEASLRASVNGYSFSIPLGGRGGRAVIAPDANPVDLGAVSAGDAGAPRKITMTNVGDMPGAFFIAIVAGGDTASFELIEEDCSGALIAPGEGCSATVRFRPQSAGAKQARLALFGENDGGTMIGLSGTGVAPALTLAPDGFQFGAVGAGGRGPAHPFVLRNAGVAPVALGGVGIVGADPDQFLVAGDACTGLSLAPGEECGVRVRFAPDSPGPKSAKLRVGYGAGAIVAALAGSGVAVPAAAGGDPAGGNATADRRAERRRAKKRAARKRAARKRAAKRRAAQRRAKQRRVAHFRRGERIAGDKEDRVFTARAVASRG